MPDPLYTALNVLYLVPAVTLLVAVAVITVAIARRPVEAQLPHDLSFLISAAQRRSLVAMALAIVVFLALFSLTIALPHLLGTPLAVAPTLAGATGLALYALTPPTIIPIDPSEPRTASLTPRAVSSFIEPRAAATFSGALVLLMGFIVFAGITSSSDDMGGHRQIAFHNDTLSSGAGPYAGWFYGIPVLACAALLVVTSWWALRRISGTAALPHADDAELDSAWRRASNSIILAIASIATLVQFGALAYLSGSAMVRAAEGISAGWMSAGAALMIIATAALSAGVAWAARTVIRVVHMPARLSRASLSKREPV